MLDSVAEWTYPDDADYVNSLAQFLHGTYSGDRFMAMLDIQAFCDESYAHVQGDGDKPFVIAGYLAPARVWMEFSGRWNMALHSEGLPYFHMSDCEAGAAPFDVDRPTRDRWQRRFIGVICQFKLRGIAAGVSQDAIAQAHSELARFRTTNQGERQSMVTPYLFSFEACISEIVRQMDGLPEEERAGLVFDQLREFEGRAHKVRAILVACQDYKGRHRIGPLTYEDKKTPRGIPLQAADVLSYEIMRSLRDPHISRWQMDELQRGYGIAGPAYYKPEHVAEFVRRLNARISSD